jgi:PAS domain S-box-containing protein
MTTDVLLTVLKNDLLANILAHAANLEACASFISLQLREIIAARLVALYERLPSGEYRPVAVCPERRTALLGEDGYRRLIHLAATCDEPTMLVPGEEEPGRLLAALGLRQSFVVPLSVENENYGLLLLLDIMDDRGLHHILEDLRSISGLLSLVFKTSYLYRNMERLVVARSDALLASEARAAQILQTAMDGFWCLDANGRITEVNDAYCQMSGYSRDELMAMSIDNLEISHHPNEIDTNIRNVLTGKHLRFEGQHRRKDGSSFHVEVSVQQRHGHSGEMFAFLRDISAQKHHEAEREQLQRRLQQAEKMEAIGTLAGGIAHDFNNILGAVIGYAEIALDDSPPGSPVANDVAQILKAGNRAKELVKQILAFSRQSALQPIPLFPAMLIKEALKLLRSSLPTTIAIDLALDPEAGPVLADPGQLHQIIMNLGTNALHAMEERGGTLAITLENTALANNQFGLAPGDYIRLAVADTGCGISPAIRERIFDPYFTTKEVGKGTGMGLAIVHGIVESYGGSISCDQRHGGGTVFTILLPRTAADMPGEAERIEKTPTGKEHILLIDDEEMLVEMGKHLLERLGYRVTTRTSSLEALTTFQNQPDLFDLVITDHTMSGMTGADLARRMLQLRPTLPIILCTGYSDQITENKAKSLGIRGFALKPLTRKDIADLIRTVLDKGKETAQTGTVTPQSPSTRED